MMPFDGLFTLIKLLNFNYIEILPFNVMQTVEEFYEFILDIPQAFVLG